MGDDSDVWLDLPGGREEVFGRLQCLVVEDSALFPQIGMQLGTLRFVENGVERSFENHVVVKKDDAIKLRPFPDERCVDIVEEKCLLCVE